MTSSSQLGDAGELFLFLLSGALRMDKGSYWDRDRARFLFISGNARAHPTTKQIPGKAQDKVKKTAGETEPGVCL
jgi:hypothetical protein